MSRKQSDRSKESNVYHISFRWSVSEDSPSNDDRIKQICTKLFDKYIYQLENTITDGRNNFHYQGYGHLKDGKSRPSTVQQIAISCNGLTNGIEMQPASTAGITALKEYAMKSDTRVRGPWSDGSLYLGHDIITNLWPWQKTVKEITEGPINARDINCIIDPIGNTGKSVFCKYMAFHHKIPVMGWSRTNDILYLVSQIPNKRCYMFDLARTRSKELAEGDIYSAMEGIKNGLFMNSKYQCTMVTMQHPHLWIFTNTMPQLTAMSADRWVLWEIKNKELIRIPRHEYRLRREDSGRVGARRRRSLSPEHASSQSTVVEID